MKRVKYLVGVGRLSTTVSNVTVSKMIKENKFRRNLVIDICDITSDDLPAIKLATITS